MKPEIEQDIVNMYNNRETITSINKKYNTCHRTVRDILKRYNIYKPIEKPKIIVLSEVEKLYLKGLNGKNIAKELNVKYTTFIAWCKKNNFDFSKKRKYPRRPNDEISRVVELNKTEFWKTINFNGLTLRSNCKNYIDQIFFEKIDSEEKAYILGYWYADGNVYKVSFQATSMDLDIIEKVRYYIRYSGKITSRSSDINNNIYYNIMMNDCKMSKDLVDKGCVEKKSLILKFPSEEIVPKNLIHHFIRGYFDGDGSLFVGKTKGWDEWGMAFVGTKEFMEGVANNLNVPVKYTQTREGRNNWTITFCKLDSLKTVINYMYKDATIAMNRKTILADKCLQYIYEHQLFKGKI